MLPIRYKNYMPAHEWALLIMVGKGEKGYKNKELWERKNIQKLRVLNKVKFFENLWDKLMKDIRY